MEKSFRYNALLVKVFIFFMPLCIIAYLQYANRILLQAHHIILIGLFQLLVFGGLMILHRQFKEKDRELRHRVFELETINEFTELAAKNVTDDHLFKSLLEKAMAVSRSQMGSIFKVEPDQERFHVIASKGLKKIPEKDFYINIKESLAKHVIRDKKSLLVQNMETDPRIHKKNNPKYGPPSFLSVPILIRDEVIGVLNLSCKKTQEIFGSLDEKIVTIMTGEIGMALENVKLGSQAGKASKLLEKNPAVNDHSDNGFDEKIHRYKRIGKLVLLGEQMASTAHDINNPVCGIISYAEILKDRFNEHGQDNDIPNRIIKEGDRIAKMVNNLLFFARDEKEEYCPANVRDILFNTFELVERQLVKSDIKLWFHMPNDLPRVKVRSNEIQQVFLSIINNAMAALNQRFLEFSEHKFLEISGKTVDIKNQKYVRTTFHDGGIGIPEEILPKVCDQFFSTKPNGMGTGLGLSISHAIIKSHGGKLRFESVAGEFTKVMVDLPAENG